MGKSKGKTILSIVGFALGAANPAMFGLKSGAWLAGGLYGASLGGTLWSATHKPKSSGENTTKFDQYMNSISSDSMIPIVYGHRKVGGYQTFHQTSASGKKLTKDVLLAEGVIEGAYGVTANNLLITYNVESSSSSIGFSILNSIRKTHLDPSLANGVVFLISNTLYPDAAVRVDDHTLKLRANGETVSIPLKKPSKLADDYSNDYQCTIAKLIQYLTEYGYTNGLKSKGWKIEYPVHVESAPYDIKEFSLTNCYNDPVAISRFGIDDCKYSEYDGSQTSPPNNYLKVGSYKNMAYIRSTLKLGDELSGGNPTITAIIKGMKIWVYRDGQWYYEYSNNPAWAVWDYLTNKRYGLGRWFDTSMLDLDAFIESADYCDELVSFKDVDGVVRQEKRYELDIILGQKKSAIEHLQDMFANFGGFLVFTNKKVGLRIEKSTSVSYSFNKENIKSDSVKFDLTELAECPNKYVIKYIDPYNNWSEISIVSEDTVDQQERGIVISKDIQLNGTIRQTQAKRLANFNKKYNKLCPMVITFSTGTYAAHLEPGDVINISWTYFNNKPFRIQQIEESKGVYTIKAREYNESVYDDNYLAEIEVKNYTSIPNAITGEIPDVESIELTQDYYKQRDGTIISTLAGTFDIPNYEFYKSATVSYSIDNGINWIDYGTTFDSNFIINNVKVGATYLIKIITTNTVGRMSEGFISGPIYITGKDNPPSNVASMSINQVIDSLHVVITEVADSDVEIYELRLGATWSNSSLVQQFVGSKLVIPAPSDGTLTYWVKAIDWSGNYSNVATKAIVNVIGLPAKNVIFTQETDPEDWTTDGLWLDSLGRFRLKSEKILADYERFSDIFLDALTYRKDAYIILPVIDLGENTLDESCYWLDSNGIPQLKTTQTLGDLERFSDIFSIIPEYVAPQYVTETFVGVQPTYTISGNARLDIEYRTSFNGVNWGAWTPSTIRQFNNRYVQVRLLPQSLDDIGQVYVTGAKVTIDVPDIEETIERLTIPNVKTRVYFKKRFTEVKSIVMWTYDTTGKFATYQKTNETNQYFDIEILDNSDNPIAGIIEKVVIRGY